MTGDTPIDVMSLKAFHIIFVVLTTLTALGVGVWELRQYFEAGHTRGLWYSLVAFAVAVGLVMYGRYVLKKLRGISYL